MNYINKNNNKKQKQNKIKQINKGSIKMNAKMWSNFRKLS